MTRTEKLETLKAHAHYGRYCAKLSARDWETLRTILDQTAALSNDTFTLYVNRLWVGDQLAPKRAHLLCELLLASRVR
jgi:hypothetical protein